MKVITSESIHSETNAERIDVDKRNEPGKSKKKSMQKKSTHFDTLLPVTSEGTRAQPKEVHNTDLSCDKTNDGEVCVDNIEIYLS